MGKVEGDQIMTQNKGSPRCQIVEPGQRSRKTAARMNQTPAGILADSAKGVDAGVFLSTSRSSEMQQG